MTRGVMMDQSALNFHPPHENRFFRRGDFLLLFGAPWDRLAEYNRKGPLWEEPAWDYDDPTHYTIGLVRKLPASLLVPTGSGCKQTPAVRYEDPCSYDFFGNYDYDDHFARDKPAVTGFEPFIVRHARSFACMQPSEG